jgi:hypothetical protein
LDISNYRHTVPPPATSKEVRPRRTSMSKKQKKIEKVEKQLREAKIVAPSSAAAQVAAFLVKNYPKDALRIAAGMESASDGKSMRRRMGRIKKEVASASASS